MSFNRFHFCKFVKKNNFKINRSKIQFKLLDNHKYTKGVRHLDIWVIVNLTTPNN